MFAHSGKALGCATSPGLLESTFLGRKKHVQIGISQQNRSVIPRNPQIRLGFPSQGTFTSVLPRNSQIQSASYLFPLLWEAGVEVAALDPKLGSNE